MIEIKNYSKSYSSHKVIENLNITLPDTGVVCLLGASGCGKTTLLNSLSGIDIDYEGSIVINNQNITKLEEFKRRDFRLQNIGYVFQTFNLLNLLTVEDNLRISLYSSSNSTKRIKEKRIHDLLDILCISHLKKKRINKLSGGEKQRVAIARALLNNPKVILCDEPTGALDENNSKKICEILKSISSNALVVIATHDLNVSNLYADLIIKFEDDKFQIINQQREVENLLTPVISCSKKTKRSSLPVLLQIKQAIEKIKSKKFRSLITNGILSISLAGIGVSLIISNNLSSKISDTFNEITNGNQIVMSLKNESPNSLGEVYTAPESRVKEITNKYSYYVSGYGSSYLINFENFFRDKNDFYVDVKGSKYYLSGYSTRTINDYKLLEQSSKYNIFPYQIDYLNYDQFVIGLTYVDMVNLCYKLQIQRSYKSLGEYIRKNRLFTYLEIENSNWQYDDEQIFEIKGVIETNTPLIFHTNSLFNQYVFENMMRLPAIDIEQQKFPWEMYKIYYLKTKEDPSTFQNIAMYDNDLYDFIFERINYSYSPVLCTSNEICGENRLYIYLADKYGINMSHVSIIQNKFPEISNYFIDSDYGYSSYASNILNGFSQNFYVSSNNDDLITAIDADSYLKDDTNINVNIPDTVVMGNYLNSVTSGIRFSNKPKELLAGRFANNNNEIVISLGLAKYLKLENYGLGTYLYMSGIKGEIVENGKTTKEYGIHKTVVTGIVNEDKNYLYQDSNWTISFFRDCLGVSTFNLIPRSIVFELEQNADTKKLVSSLNSMFISYKFVSPLTEIEKSISSTFEYANILLIAFSVLASLISVLLLGTTILLNILESKDEIILLNFLGIRNDDIQSTFIVQSLVQGFIAFFVSVIEIIIVDYFISYSLSDMFKVATKYTLNPTPILIVFLVSILMPLIVGFIMSKILIKRKKY